jgi:uncharacterized protein YkwD
MRALALAWLTEALRLGAALAAAMLCAAAWAGEPVAKGGYVADDKPPLPREAQTTLQQINAYRARGATCGSRRMEPAPALEWNPLLQRAAEVQVRHMGRLGDVTHDGADGSSVGARVTREGYAWSTVGENVAAGRAQAAATLAQWMASPGHCSNLMNAAFREVAVVGLSAGGAYGTYWVMVLAAPQR